MTFLTDISGFLLWMVAKSCSWWTKSPWETPWKWRLNLLGKAWNWMGDFHCYVWLKVTQNPEFDGLESLLTGHCMGIFSDTAASWIHILHETPIRPHISPKNRWFQITHFEERAGLLSASLWSRWPLLQGLATRLPEGCGWNPIFSNQVMSSPHSRYPLVI